MVRETSIDAYLTKYLPTASEKQETVLRYLHVVEDGTNLEISNATGMTINTTTSTVFALRELGLLSEAPIRKCRHTGNEVHAWSLVGAPRIKGSKEPKRTFFVAVESDLWMEKFTVFVEEEKAHAFCQLKHCDLWRVRGERVGGITSTTLKVEVQ